MPRPSFAPILALVGSVGLVTACQDDDAPCSLSICNVEHEACHAEAFEVIACAREFQGEPPPVEVIDSVEYDARFVEAPQDATAKLRDQQMQELLRALLLEPGALHDEPRPIAFYSLDTEQVIVVTTEAFDDETRVFVLMQALANAQQAQEIDLRFLLQEQPTSDAAIAAAALVHGEAHFSANLGMQMRRTGVELDAAVGFYSELENQALATASDPSMPYTFAVEDFIYGYGGGMVALRWNSDGREGVNELLRTPPRSTHEIVSGQAPGSVPTSPPASPFELEPPYEAFAVDVLGAWMFEIVLRRVPDSSTWDWYAASNILAEWGGDEAVFIGGETPSDAALYWKLELGRLAQTAGDVLAMGVAERDLPWLLQVTEDGHLILVITPDAAARPEWAARLGL